MPRLHIIIGDADTRKSSLMRCLTGVSGGRSANQNMDIALTNGTIIRVHCTTSALQESLNPRTPAQFIAEVQGMSPAPTDIAITLRVRARGSARTGGPYPNATTYLSAFSQVNWPVANVALLGSAACALQPLAAGPNIAVVPNSPYRPTNETAAQVRQVWGWL